jgi:hypothetical protein
VRNAHTGAAANTKMVSINLRVHVKPPAMMMPNPKKSQNKNPLCLRQWGDVGMWSTLFAFTFLIAVALSLAAIRLNV